MPLRARILSMRYIPIGPSSDRPGSEGHQVPSESEYREFYVAYGEAMAAWAIVEQNLLAVFHFHTAPREYAVGSGIYWKLQGFRARLDVTDAAVEASGRSADELKEWKRISEKLGRKSKSRNKLAHYTPCYGREREGLERQMFLGDPKSPFSNSVIKKRDLEEWAASFDLLAKETIEFFLRSVDERSSQP